MPISNVANTLAFTRITRGAPYYDDFDESKNFNRILFRPGFAVQARELTQLQTLLQKQVDRFGKHIFKEGSRVSGGQFNIEKNVDYVKIKDLDANTATVTVRDYIGQTLTGQTSGVVGYVINALEGTETDTNAKTLFIRYTEAGNDNVTRTFANNEALLSNLATIYSFTSGATGLGSSFTINTGVVFAKEHFIAYDTQTVILDRYNPIPTCKVGFIIEENIVKYTEDQSLLDPAQESSNYSAPGADRLKLTAVLTRLDIDDPAVSPDYAELFVIKDGVVQVKNEDTQYSIIDEYFTKRTYEESGDYYVNGLNIRIRENLDNGENGGYDANGNNQFLSVGVESGLAYIKGYRVYKRNPDYVTLEKAYTSEAINSQIASARQGNYIIVNEFVGAWPHNVGTAVQFYDAAMGRLTNNLYSTAAQTGAYIGTANLKSVVYESGVTGSNTAQWRIYVSDVRMLGTNTFSNVRSLYINNPTDADAGADVVLESNVATLKESSAGALLYPVGAPYVKTIRDTLGVPDTTFSYYKSSSATIGTNGTFSVGSLPTDEIFPYGNITLDSLDKREIFVTVNETFNIAHSGTVSTTAGSTTVVGTNLTRLNVGDRITVSDNTRPRIVTAVPNATHIFVDIPMAGTGASNTLYRSYKTGDTLNFHGVGLDSGVARTISATSTTLSFDMKETMGTTRSATVVYPVTRTSAREIKKDLRSGRYVKINCATAGTTGPFNLGIADLYRITGITKKTGSAPTSMGDGTDVTSLFTVDNGQRDEFYDHAKITPNGVTLGGTDYLLVELDYFNPNFTQGVGYFSVDSYPIDDTLVSSTTIQTAQIPVYRSPTSGAAYDLRNFLDFRPVKTNTATDTTVIASASTNPTTSSTFASEANGLRLPVPSSQITYDYSYYLPRRDVVVMDKDGVVSIIKGKASLAPVTPATPENTMALAKLYITPYPSIAPSYAADIGRPDLGCSSKKTAYIRFTMRDIGVLKNRIENLEYYAALNALEKSALDFQILDENGLDRFKNGIFVDTFRNHDLGATYNNDYRIAVDPDEKSIRPIFEMESIEYDYVSGTNITKTGDLITLPYTQVVYSEQPNVTTYRNNETSIYKFIGNLYLDPSFDMWVDTAQLPDNVVPLESYSETPGGPLTTEWNAWERTITGYRVIDSTTGDVIRTFNANQRDDALRMASQISSDLTVRTNSFGYAGPSVSTTVEETSSSARTGTESFKATTNSQESLGNSVVDVNIIPYIRPQVIRIDVRGVKANTRYFTYFDGENMSAYTTPANSSYAATGAEGAAVVSNANGEVHALLRIPTTGKKFFTGTKTVLVTDSPTADTTATSYAQGAFVAAGLTQQKQETILSTRTVINYENQVAQSGPNDTRSIATNRRQVVTVTQSGACMAYSLPVKTPEGEEGMFLTGADVYFAAKHPTLGVWFEVREMDAGGGITSRQVPFSEVWVNSADIVVSSDASLPHNVTFPAPIFLYNNKQYAFVIHTVAANPDTYVWVSKIGQVDIITGNPVTSRAFTGTLYTTNNNTNWDMVPDTDLKVKFYRASFNTGVTGSTILGNRSTEILSMNASTSQVLTHYGEPIVGNDRLTLSGYGGASIVAGDLIVGNTSAANIAVANVNSGTYQMANTGFILNEPAVVRSAANTFKGLATVNGVTTPRGNLYRYRASMRWAGELANKIITFVKDSNGSWAANDWFRGTLSGNTARVDLNTIEKLRYSTIDFEPEFIKFNDTTVDFEMRAATTAGIQTDWFPVSQNDNYYFDEEMAIHSRSDELTLLPSSNSNQVRVSMTSGTTYLSPVLDVGKMRSVYIHNIVNSNTDNETAASGGELINKYISKTITLADDQDAEDLKVVLTAYRPPNTDVKVYVKLLHNEDGDAIASKNWVELAVVDNSLYSSLADKNNFIEYSYEIPASMLTGPNGEVQYTTAGGTTFTGYKQFAIKIGLSATNSAIVPRVADLRCIALQI